MVLHLGGDEALEAMSAYNPRYLAYCRSRGESDPEEQLAKDEVAYPGGCMVGFLCWSAWQLAAYRKLKPEAFLDGRLVDQQGYDRWLNQIYPLEAA